MTDFTGAFFHKTGPGTSSNNQNIGATYQATGDKLAGHDALFFTRQILGVATGVLASASDGGGGGGDGDSDSTPTQVWSDG